MWLFIIFFVNCLSCKNIIDIGEEELFMSKCRKFPLKTNYTLPGFDTTDYSFCQTARNSQSMCGIKGRYYQSN